MLAASSVHVARGGLLVAGAAAFGVLALSAPGPLGALRVCGPRLHALLDVVVPLALAVAPVLAPLRPDAVGIAVVEVAALAWIRLATLTRDSRPTPRPAPDATGGGSGAPGVGRARLSAGARWAGRGTARLQRKWRAAQDGGS